MAKLTYQCGIFLTVTAFVLLLCGCISTTSPVVYTDNPKKDFEILGEVTYDSKMSIPGIQKNGFTALLAAARTKYPNCDYVIDIMIDKKTTFVLFIFPHTNYVMRGTAIRYIKMNQNGNAEQYSIGDENSANQSPAAKRGVYTVEQIIGLIEQVSGNGKTRIKVGDTLDGNTTLQLSNGSTLVLAYGSTRFTINGAKFGSIDELLPR